MKNFKGIGCRQQTILALLEENGAMTVKQMTDGISVGKGLGVWYDVCGIDYTRVHALEKRGLIKRTDAKVQTYVLTGSQNML